jgi:hypothetical protein
MNGRSRAVLVITSGVMSSSDLAVAIGLEPDSRWQMGDKRGNDSRDDRHQASGVEYGSQCDRAMPPDMHVADLAARLGPYMTNIRTLIEDRLSTESATGRPAARCWIYYESDESSTGFDLSSSAMLPLVSAGCTIGINIDFVARTDHEQSPAEG